MTKSTKLKKISKDAIIKSTLWKPPDTSFELEQKTNSWFNIDKMNDDMLLYENRLANSTTIRSRPISIIPTVKQKAILLQWNEIYRRVYNLTVKYLKTNKIQSFQKMRPIIDGQIALDSILTTDSNKSGIPKHTRDNAIKDCLKAYKTAFSNYRAGNIKYFKIRYKRKSHHLSSIVIEPVAFSKDKKMNGFAIKTLGNMKSSEPLKGIDKECRLCYNSRSNKFILRVPYDKETSEHVVKGNMCSLDPGMRTFQTVYAPQGNCYEICSNKTSGQIYKLIERIEKAHPNANVDKFKDRLREKISNKIKDMHWKTVNYLCKSFETIIVGNMSTQSIVSKDKMLPKITKKYCMALSHYSFTQRLISKAEEFGCKVVITDESYTSKTCGGCGELNNGLGSKKVFTCENCPYKVDRDINGARNIMIKYLSN
jgi:IS605 OrfB family transposase